MAVWGVDARPGQDGIDCAQTPPAPIHGIEQFESDARRLAGQLLMLRHEGIHIAHIKASEPEGAGYLLVYVERSERRPHRCEASGEKGYFKRAGESTFAMEHYDIEDAFRRVAAPSIVIEIIPSYEDKIKIGDAWEERLHFKIYIENDSDVVAKYIYLKLGDLRNCEADPWVKDSISPFTRRIPGDGWDALYCGTEFVLHPGDKFRARDVLVRRRELNGKISLGFSGRSDASAHFAVIAGCENARQVHLSREIDVPTFDRMVSASI